MEAERILREATTLCLRAEADRNRAIRLAAEEGMSKRKIAAITGTTVQRVLRAVKSPGGSSKSAPGAGGAAAI